MSAGGLHLEVGVRIAVMAIPPEHPTVALERGPTPYHRHHRIIPQYVLFCRDGRASLFGEGSVSDTDAAEVDAGWRPARLSPHSVPQRDGGRSTKYDRICIECVCCAPLGRLVTARPMNWKHRTNIDLGMDRRGSPHPRHRTGQRVTSRVRYGR